MNSELRYISNACMDGQNRILVKAFCNLPRKVILVINADFEMIEILDADTNTDIEPTLIDDKGRLTVPAWIRKELRNTYKEPIRNFYLISYQGRRFISPKTGNII